MVKVLDKIKIFLSWQIGAVFDLSAICKVKMLKLQDLASKMQNIQYLANKRLIIQYFSGRTLKV